MYLIEQTGRHSVLLALLCLGVLSASCTSTMSKKDSPDAIAATADPAATLAPAPIPSPTTESAQTPAPAIPAEEIAAKVNDKPITIWDFNARYSATMRDRFYHGKPPEGQVEAVRKEVLDLLIDNALLVEEAEKRGLKPDETKFEQAAANAEARYSYMPEWKRDRAQVLSMIRTQVERQNLVEQVSKALREVPQPTPAEVRAFYDQKPELFTEPEKLRLSLILLKVDPGAPRTDLDKVREEAQGIYLQLKNGADFAEMARQRSGDGSAERGGDLGYVHGGMLPEKLQEKIDKFQVGVVAEPIRVLEGIALYRLDAREAPILREFNDVEARAQELVKRDQQELAWKEAISRLRGSAKIEIFLPMADTSVKPIADSGAKQSSGTGAEQVTASPSSDKQSETATQKVEKKKSSKKKSSKRKKVNDKNQQ